jgi:hypothetical protein
MKFEEHLGIVIPSTSRQFSENGGPVQGNSPVHEEGETQGNPSISVPRRSNTDSARRVKIPNAQTSWIRSQSEILITSAESSGMVKSDRNNCIRSASAPSLFRCDAFGIPVQLMVLFSSVNIKDRPSLMVSGMAAPPEYYRKFPDGARLIISDTQVHIPFLISAPRLKTLLSLGLTRHDRTHAFRIRKLASR